MRPIAVVQVALSRAAWHPVAVVPAIVLWGVAAFATVPGWQTRVLDRAAEAPALASTLNIAAFHSATPVELGPGGRALAMDLPLVQLPLPATALALVAAGVLASTTFKPRLTRTRRTP